MAPKTQKYFVSKFLIFTLSFLLVFPSNLKANSEGIQLEIISDRVVKGELLEVKQGSVIMMEHGTKAGITIEFNKIYRITIKRKSKFRKGLFFGLLIGAAVGGIAAIAQGPKDDNVFAPDFSGAAVIGIAVWGVIIGGIVGLAKGKYKRIYDSEKSKGKLDKVLKKLNKKARYPNPNLKK